MPETEVKEKPETKPEGTKPEPVNEKPEPATPPKPKRIQQTFLDECAG